jgi:hypothetical protein
MRCVYMRIYCLLVAHYPHTPCTHDAREMRIRTLPARLLLEGAFQVPPCCTPHAHEMLSCLRGASGVLPTCTPSAHPLPICPLVAHPLLAGASMLRVHGDRKLEVAGSLLEGASRCVRGASGVLASCRHAHLAATPEGSREFDLPVSCANLLAGAHCVGAALELRVPCCHAQLAATRSCAPFARTCLSLRLHIDCTRDSFPLHVLFRRQQTGKL